MSGHEEDDLRTLANQSSRTLDEKIRTLAARDRRLRANRQRQTDLASAQALEGCCQDMCPEYERYCRQERALVCVFEMTDGTPDEYKMVKEYTRSGADQLEPLPYELRPAAVLQRTMNYLLCNVMDAGNLVDESAAGEWFDFLWSRTRSIRKDITQQHLCDVHAVQLFEQCVRFHILCAHELCEHGRMIFDQKINDENLSKCLQSLKQLYADLALKQIYCPNEPEFRCYELLFNLTDAESLTSLKHLPSSIRNSPPVRFALRVQYAIHSGNFVRFFALIRETTFLNACVLHRHFNQVRIQAVERLKKASPPGSASEAIPNDTFIRLLALDDHNDLSQFCESVTLPMNRDHVTLIKSETVYNSLKIRRSKTLVNEKRNSLLGEIVYGGPLPENPYRKFPLSSSFDENGKLTAKALEGTGQSVPGGGGTGGPSIFARLHGSNTSAATKLSSGVTFGATSSVSGSTFLFGKTSSGGFSFDSKHKDETNATTVNTEKGDKKSAESLFGANFSFPKTLEPKKPEVDQQKVTEIANDLLKDLVDRHAREHVSQFFVNLQINRVVFTLTEQLATEAAARMARQAAMVEYDRAMQQLKYERIVQQLIESCSSLITEDLLADICQALLGQVCRVAYRDAVDEFVDRKAIALTKIILDQTNERLCRSTVHQCHQALLKDQDERIQRMRTIRAWRLTGNCFRHWLQIYRRNKYWRHIRDTFPASDISFKKLTRRSLPLQPVDNNQEPFSSDAQSASKPVAVKPTLSTLLVSLRTPDAQCLDQPDSTCSSLNTYEQTLDYAENKIKQQLSNKLLFLDNKLNRAKQAGAGLKHFLDATLIMREMEPPTKENSCSLSEMSHSPTSDCSNAILCIDLD